MKHHLSRRARTGKRRGQPAKTPEEVSWKLEVEKLLPGGEGLARSPLGLPVFLSRVVPGDEVSITQVISSKSFFRAHRFEVLVGGEERIEPSCEYYQTCGGCDWMALSAHAQGQQKQQLFREALRRTGGFDPEQLPDIRWNASPRAVSYRRRIRLGLQGRQLGFRRQKSHELVELSHCKVIRSELVAPLGWLKRLVAQHPVIAQCAYEVELALIGSTIQIHFFIKPKEKAHLSGLRSLLSQALESDPCPAQWSFSTDNLAESLNKLPLTDLVLSKNGLSESIWTYLAPGGFAQVNEEGNHLLIQAVLDVAESCHAQTFLDVFCGSGNFAFPLAARGLDGVGVEFEPLSIVAAKRAAQEQHRSLRFYAADASEFIEGLLQTERSFDLLVIDPPRTGAKELIPLLARLAHRTLIYISCDPVTLARDLRKLAEYGFEVLELQAFDLFPETHHVESLAVLRAPETSKH